MRSRSFFGLYFAKNAAGTFLGAKRQEGKFPWPRRGEQAHTLPASNPGLSHPGNPSEHVTQAGRPDKALRVADPLLSFQTGIFFKAP